MIRNKILKETYLNYRFIINKIGLAKNKFFIVILLTLFTAILDGIGILLPIAEYILNQKMEVYQILILKI